MFFGFLCSITHGSNGNIRLLKMTEDVLDVDSIFEMKTKTYLKRNTVTLQIMNGKIKRFHEQ